MTGKIII